MYKYLLITLISCLLHHDISAQNVDGISIQGVFVRAVQSYKDEKFSEAIKGLESGLVHWRMLKHIDINCGLRCISPNISKETGLDTTGFEELMHYGNMLAQANCVKICKEEHPFSKSNIKRPNDAFIADFEKREPYNYLQYAYYKTGQIKKACKAAHTYYKANPQDTQGRENIAFYKGLDEVLDTDFTDLEGSPYSEFFNIGVVAYEKKNYNYAVENLEKALIDYFMVHDECKTLCYVGKPLTFFYQFPQAIVARYLPAVECSLKCEEKLRPLIGEYFMDKFVAKIYSYLQFSYYKLGKLEMAVPAASSALLLDPDDKMSVSNFKYYTENAEEHGLNPKIHLHPRPEAFKYHLEQKTNKELLSLIQKVVDYEDEAEVEEKGGNSLEDNLMEEISRQITLSISENLRGDVDS